MRRAGVLFGLTFLASAQTRVVDFTVRENAGIERKGALVEQGIPAPARSIPVIALSLFMSVSSERVCAVGAHGELGL